MGRGKKPGAPGRGAIPPEIVREITRRLLAEFRKRGYARYHRLFVVPQQCYLYMEVEEKDAKDRGPRPPVTKSSTVHIPLGRLKYLGEAERWEYHPYRFSDEYWEPRDCEYGKPEDLLISGVLERNW